MVPVWRTILTIIIVLTLDQGSIASDVDTITNADELLINEGDPLKIKCTGSTNISFIYPNSQDTIRTSEPYIVEEFRDGTYTYLFERRETVHGDTGLYGCPDSTLEIITSPPTPPPTPLPTSSPSKAYRNLVYVYVQSNTHVFVEDYALIPLHGLIGETAIVPCRPTSPHFIVNCTFSDSLKQLEDFNPRIGFRLTNLTLNDSGYILCSISSEGMQHRITYHLNVHRKQPLNKPKILDTTLGHVTRGQTLRVNCTTKINVDAQFVFNWNTPQKSDRIKTRLYINNLGSDHLVNVELTIQDVQDEDEGLYNCTIRTFYNSSSTSKYIKIHDPKNKFINLTTQDTVRRYQLREGDKVQWVVYVNAYPQPVLKWLNPKGQEIEGNWNDEDKKYAVKVTPTQTILSINHLNINDMGEYALQAINQDQIETLNFTLDVLVRPLPILKVESYYALNEVTEISCDVATYPSPNISWTFIKCPYYPSCENASTIELTSTKESGMNTTFRSTVRMKIEMSGQLSCTACNIIGCESQAETILVSDGVGGFGIIKPEEPVTVGDNLELTCAASIYNYTDKFVWKYGNDTPIVENDRLTIEQSKTPFTYRSILKIKNVKKSDSTRYVCSNKEEVEYDLQVYNAEAPYFKETNLQENETIIDFNKQGHQTIILKCLVGGMPKPNITWYKDDKVLQMDDQYMYTNNRQMLHIKYLLESDSGKYSCEVTNRLGTIKAYVTLTIKGKGLPIEFIILFIILLITVVILVIYFTIKVRREKIMRKELMEAGLMHFEEGAVECLNPDLTVDDQAELLPYDKKWEFPREKLKFGRQLGSGAFGVVMKAEAEGICENEPVTTVAVKMVRRTTVPTCVRALASELKIMVHLGKHLNVVNLLGACTKNISKRELLVIVEYCRFGNLHNYLLRHRADFINQIDPATDKFDPSIGQDILTRSVSVSSSNRIKYVALTFSRSLGSNSANDSTLYQTSAMDSQGVSMSPDGCVLSNNSSQPAWRSNYRGDYKDQNLKPICTQDLLSWAFQVARGMEYLSQRRVLHGDLAARNILLAENNVVKICDFGLAKTMYKDNNYKKKSDGLLPIKWMAIESIRDRIFSTQSDIWSFGVVLWEFFTLAKTPYPGMEAEKQYQKLIEGYRMEQPEYATSEVYDIMLQCWKAKPTLRPSFTELVKSIGELLEESVRAHYISLNDPYMDMNTTMMEGGRSDYLTMLSAPDHTTLSSPTHDYTNMPTSNANDSAYLCMSPTCPADESGIFSPRGFQQRTCFEFPSVTSDSEDAVEMSPMLKKPEDDDPYLKPINVHERRAEFVRQSQAMKNQAKDQPADRDSGYCNTPRNIQLIDLNVKNEKNENDLKEESQDNEKSSNENKVSKKDYMPAIIRTQDNYVNMPKQKSDLRLDMPDGFSNPSYVMMSNREMDQMRA
ncbi:PDGF- and VEGF-receptor related [Xylocopa sonorina]|uniref:PDGF- and VEGF-receptor related n=1 Tax=Xylocopa sonorina TaxID=1818115 RepID=UPI00403AF882